MERLRSRKFWITIAAGAVFGALRAANVDVPDEIVKVIVAYIAGQSAVDIASVIARSRAPQ
jgi:hypothetical protein